MSAELYKLMKGDLCQLQANCMLARIWRTTLYDLNVEPSIWESRLRDYIERAAGVIGEKEADRLKGNLPKRLVGDHVTFQTLCRALTVLRFRKVELTVHIYKDGEMKSHTITIPETYDGSDANKFLKVLWVMITQSYPEVTANWSEYIKKYKERVTKEQGTSAVNLGGNITSVLNTDRITWKNLYDGIMIHDIEKLGLELTLHRTLDQIKVGILAS